MTVLTRHIGIVSYPGVMESAVTGLTDMLQLANHFSTEHSLPTKIEPIVIDFTCSKLDQAQLLNTFPPLYAIVLPPCISGEYYLSPEADLVNWILHHHNLGTIISAVCAGTFILCTAGLLDGRAATTHWKFEEKIAERQDSALMDTNKTLINNGDVITAGGVMSWIDLGLEIVAQCTHPKVMRELGRFLIVDTGVREQRYYISFTPKLSHGDTLILKAQHHIQKHFGDNLSTEKLSEISSLTQRTFLRRFTKATGLKPLEYVQRVRIQNACDLLETNSQCVESISESVGYADSSAFRRVFHRTIGLSPRDFRKRFQKDITPDYSHEK